MKRLLTLLAAGLLTNAAAAQAPLPPGASYTPGYATVGGPSNIITPSATPIISTTAGCDDCANQKNSSGLLAKFKGLFAAKTSERTPRPVDNTVVGKLKYQSPPPATGGTLAFPHHPYVRGPRDWFQQD